MFDDDNDKWFCITIMALFVCIGLGASISEYYNHLESQTALENGYVQQVVDSRVIWVKKETTPGKE